MKLGRQLAQMQVSQIRFYPEFPQTRFQDSQYSWILLGSLTKCQSKDSDIITVFVGFMGLFEHGGTSYPLVTFVTRHCLAEYCHCLGLLRPGGVFMCFHAILLPYVSLSQAMSGLNLEPLPPGPEPPS